MTVRRPTGPPPPDRPTSAAIRTIELCLEDIQALLAIRGQQRYGRGRLTMRRTERALIALLAEVRVWDAERALLVEQVGRAHLRAEKLQRGIDELIAPPSVVRVCIGCGHQTSGHDYTTGVCLTSGCDCQMVHTR